MPRYAQLVMGPAGSGKSTYCHTIQQHCETLRRTVHVVNLDPAAEHFNYPVLADIRDLISVEDAMDDEALRFGPNGGLIFCMEYFAQNFQWLHEALDDIEDDYILFDCPGQIELYTHVPVMRQLVEQLHQWNFNVCGVFIIDAQFLLDTSKYVSGVLSALSAMVNLEIPHISVMSKLDLLSAGGKKKLEQYLEPDIYSLMAGEGEGLTKLQKLNNALANVIDDYSLVKFLPLDITDEESISDLVLQADMCIQYGEDLEPREPRDMEADDQDDDDDNYNDDT